MSSVESGGSHLDREASLEAAWATSQEAVDCQQEMAQLKSKRQLGLNPSCLLVVR